MCFTSGMKQNGPTTKQLLRAVAAGAVIKVVFGRQDVTMTHAPRTKFDPQPWTDGCFRYHAWELTAEEQGR